MSRSLGTNSGSFDSLNRRTRCGCSPCACQMRCTEETLMPTVLAISPAVQCVVSSDGSSAVRATTCSMISRVEWFAARRTGFVTQQTVHALLHEPFLPAPHDGFGAPSAAHDSVGAEPLRRQQDDLCPPDVLLRAVAVCHHCPETSTVGAGHIYDDPLAHRPDSHAQRE